MEAMFLISQLAFGFCFIPKKKEKKGWVKPQKKPSISFQRKPRSLFRGAKRSRCLFSITLNGAVRCEAMNAGRSTCRHDAVNTTGATSVMSEATRHSASQPKELNTEMDTGERERERCPRRQWECNYHSSHFNLVCKDVYDQETATWIIRKQMD